MMKAMMVNSSCNTVNGDDTASNGFELIVNEDDECDCQVVRALAPGRNNKITVENNILRVDVLRSPVPPIPPSGGGLITVTLRLSNFDGVFSRTIFITYTNPIIITQEDLTELTVPPFSPDNTILMWMGDNLFTGGSPGPTGILMMPNASLYIVDPPITTQVMRPGIIRTETLTSRIVIVPEQWMSSWKERTNNDGASYLIARFDATPGVEMLKWVPGAVSFPLNRTTDEKLMDIVLTYDSDTGKKSWIKQKHEEALPVEKYNFLQTINGGTTVLYRNINNFTFVMWFGSIVISHIPTSSIPEGTIEIRMPRAQTNIININRNGVRGTNTVQNVGIELGVNFKALFFDLATSEFISVENGAPVTAYNPNASWVLICCVSPSDRSLAWLPGRINIPFNENNFSEYSNATGRMSWATTPLRRVANTTDSTEEATTSISYICDIQTTSKFLKITKADDVVTIDATELEKSLTASTNRLNSIQVAMQPRRFISAVVKFDDLAVLNNTGVQTLASRHIRRLSDGVIQITFPVAIVNANYGVLLSMNIDNKAGVIQYSNQTRTTVNISTFNFQEKLTTFSGNFTLEIII